MGSPVRTPVIGLAPDEPGATVGRPIAVVADGVELLWEVLLELLSLNCH